MNNPNQDQATKQENASTNRLAFSTLTGFIALGMGSGLAPKAPGTVGTLAAILLAIPLQSLSQLQYLVFLVVAFAVGVYSCEKTSQRMGVQDPGAIVWDEFVAMWLVLAFVPFHWTWWLAAFALFRLFDILKPWPIRWLDRNLKGGIGIMFDDILAAFYAIVLLLLAQRQWS